MNVAREAAIWELEEQHLKDKAQLARRQLKDLYFLKRHQMITRHEKVAAHKFVLEAIGSVLIYGSRTTNHYYPCTIYVHN